MSKFTASLVIMLFLICVSPHSHSAFLKKDKTVYFPTDKLPKESLVPGGIALIPFKFSAKEPPRVTFQDQRVMVLNTAKNHWVAVVGLSLNLKPDTYTIAITRKRRVENIHFEIVDKAYEEQHITLKEKKHVNPNAAGLDRIGEESAIMKSVFSTWSEHSPPALTMSIPVEGRLSSQFGLKRFFNNEARNPHSGIDIAAERGSAIQNPLPGIVAAVGKYYFNGNTVLIDHGQGMISMYCHLEEIQVIPGQTLATGEPIGTVGSSGRATGPHLHWSLNLNNTRVDPLLFIEEISNTVEKTIDTIEETPKTSETTETTRQ